MQMSHPIAIVVLSPPDSTWSRMMRDARSQGLMIHSTKILCWLHLRTLGVEGWIHALLAGSPAIDAGPAVCLSSDQRHQSRQSMVIEMVPGHAILVHMKCLAYQEFSLYLWRNRRQFNNPDGEHRQMSICQVFSYEPGLMVTSIDDDRINHSTPFQCRKSDW